MDKILDEVEKDRAFYEASGGGLTVSGGEPLHQLKFLISLLSAARQRQLRTAVDTSGAASQAAINSIAVLADLFLYDVKCIDPELHVKKTGMQNSGILENLALLCSKNIPVWVRIPLVAGVNDSEHEIAAIGDLISSLKGIERVEVLPYHRYGESKYANLGLNSPQPQGMLSDESIHRAVRQLAQCVSFPVRLKGDQIPH